MGSMEVLLLFSGKGGIAKANTTNELKSPFRRDDRSDQLQFGTCLDT